MTAKEYIINEFSKESVDPTCYIEHVGNVTEHNAQSICWYGCAMESPQNTKKSKNELYNKFKYNENCQFKNTIWLSACIYTTSDSEKKAVLNDVVIRAINTFSKIGVCAYFEINSIVVYESDGDFISFTEDEEGQQIVEQANYKVVVYIPFKSYNEE